MKANPSEPGTMRIRKPEWIRPGRGGFGMKAVIIVTMILLFLIPLQMIKDLVWERENRKWEAEESVFSSWGSDTAVGGPLLVIPRRVNYDITDENGKYLRTGEYIENIYLLPDEMEINARSSSESKFRGIFEVPVFTISVEGSGTFALEALYKTYEPHMILWEEAYVQFSYPSLKGMNKTTPLLWEGKEYDFEAGDSSAALYGAALKAKVDAGRGDARDISRVIPFHFKQEIRGGRSLEFLPLAGNSVINLESDWPAPSFQGYYLPTSQNITEEGFTARWEVNALSRSVPDCWSESQDQFFADLRESAFGLNFFPEFDSYQKTRRTVEYGILFLMIPFLTFFLFELIRKVRIHPVQYLLAGFGNVLFYLLLLSLSEHMDFPPSYLIASAAVTGLLTLYTLSIKGVGYKALYLLPVMSAGYGYLYFVLKSEDYALIMGTAGLFGALSLTMFLTRGINWYGSGDSSPSEAEDKTGSVEDREI
ncbi:MAG: cell envelope integrity protein CreD [Spirochaetales bacterium]|nr:cell envelope integrity protein CreD [Spirochaetales bacterium]